MLARNDWAHFETLKMLEDSISLYKRAIGFFSSLKESYHEESVYERAMLTPPLIESWHVLLMQRFLYNAGKVRTEEALAGLPGSGVHFFAKPEVITSLMFAACHLYNAALLLLKERSGEDISMETNKNVYMVASSLFLQDQCLTIANYHQFKIRFPYIFSN